MAWAHVQSRSADLGTVDTPGTLAFLSNVTAGNLIVIAYTRGGGAGADIVTGVTDTLGNTYTRTTNGFQTDSTNQQGLWVYYAKNTAGGANTVSVACTGGALPYNALAIHEYSGGDTTAPFDVGNGQFDTTGSVTTDADVSLTATTTAAGDLIFGAVMATSTGATAWAPGTGFTERQEITAASSSGMQTEDLVQTNAGSIQATWTASDTSQYDAIFAAFKVASGPVTAWEQEGFRWRADDGSETTATWLAAQDANITRTTGVNTRLRMLVDTTTADPPTSQLRLEYKEDSLSIWKPAAAAGGGALAFGTAGTVATGGTTSISVAYPASIAAGDLLVLCLANRPNANTPDLPSGWSNPTNYTGTGGAGAEAAGTGTVRGTVFLKEAVGTETGSLTVTLTSGTSFFGRMFRYTKTTGKLWSTAIAVGSDNTAGTAWSATAASDPGVLGGDIVLVSSASSEDTPAFASEALSQSGITFGTMTEQQDTGITTGNDLHLTVADFAVTSGTSSAAPVFTMTGSGTNSANSAGVSHFLRIRQIDEPIQLALSSNITASGDATTAQLTAPAGKTTGDFGGGRMQDDENPADTVDLADTEYGEWEWCLAATATAVLTEVYEFRVTRAGTVLDTYTLTPTWTIGSVGLSVSVSDSSTVTESISVKLALALSVADTSTITESQTLAQQPLLVSIVDSSTTTDVPALVFAGVPLSVSVADISTVTETQTLAFQPLLLNVADSLTVTESQTLIQSLRVSVVDSSTLTDTPALATVSVGTGTGLDFPGSGSGTIRFKFTNPHSTGLPIYPATYIWRAYPRQQTGYYTAFFWGNDDGAGNISTFTWDSGGANTYYGAHPYPQGGGGGTVHDWEISVNAIDPVNGAVDYDRWHIQALRVWSDGSGKHHEFYWDLPLTDASHRVTQDAPTTYGNTNPPAPALTWGDAPWSPGQEVWDGILRGFQIYSADLSLADIIAEVNAPLSTVDGAANIWYLNINPTPTDISDKSGEGHHPAWVGAGRPALASVMEISVADSSTVTELVTLALRLSVSVTDSSTVTDIRTLTPPLSPAVTDILTISETQSLTINPVLVSATDAVTVADSRAVVLPLALSLFDTLTLAEIQTLILNPELVSVSETITTTDAQTVQILLTLSLFDGVTVTDSQALTLPLALTGDDSSTVSDVPTVVILLSVSASDASTVTDTTTVSIPIAASIMDASTLLDIQTLAFNPLLLTVDDPITVTDQPTVALAGASLQVVASDALTVTEVQALTLNPQLVSVADSIATTENQTLVLPLSVSASDSSTVTDTQAVTLPLALSISDASTVTDSQAVVIPLSLALADSSTLTDISTVSLPLTVSTTDSSTLTEVQTLTLNPLLLSVGETITVLDALTILFAGAALQVTMVDTLAVTEVQALAMNPLLASVADASTVTEAQSLILPLALAVSDASTVTDSRTVTMGIAAGLAVSVSDSLTLAEVQTLQLPLSLAVSEANSVTDEATALVPLFVSAVDSSAVGDAVSVQLPLSVFMADDIGAIDAAILIQNPLLLVAVDTVALTDSSTIVMPATFHLAVGTDIVSVSEFVHLATTRHPTHESTGWWSNPHESTGWWSNPH